ncbi:MAG: 3-dehydroquinate synthase [Myxococcales bacterium]|nr:3-dehydroquinate synthase [Myxococcales bacterium]
MSSCLYLAGPPGVGKSTIGALCAARLGWRLVDTDEELARRLGLSVPAIFAHHGEAYFRAHEAALCSELATAAQVVIATGGGTLLHEPSRLLLEGLGVGVCLTATTEELVRRLGTGLARPLLGPTAPEVGQASLTERLDALLRDRAAVYHALPYHLDTTTATPESIAEVVCRLIAVQHERLVVTHPTGRYDLAIGTDLLDLAGYAVASRGYCGPIAIVSDTHVGPLYARRMEAGLKAAGISCSVHLFSAGEANKNLSTVESLCQALSGAGVERGGAVLALGGGVVGDVAGLVAATYLRGIGLIQVPTSLLAMADSSIGGKVGVDLAAGKNLIGAFKHPDLVVLDLGCLSTLPPAELTAGLAEVVKAALIAGGDAYARVQALAEHGPRGTKPESGAAVLPALLGPLRDALQLKAGLVQEDPYEHGARILLNLGHTFAHGLEAFSRYELRHGEAVALGLVCAVRLSARLGLCAPQFPAELTLLLHKLGLPTTLPIPPNPDRPDSAQRSASDDGTDDDKFVRINRAVEAIWAFMQHDKKKRERRNRFVLLRAPGDVFACDFVDGQQAKDAVWTLFSKSLAGPGRTVPTRGSVTEYSPQGNDR